MFRKLYTLLIVGILAGGGWMIVKNNPGLLQGLPAGNAQQAGNAIPPARPGPTIRIASFNIQVFGEKKFSDNGVVDILARVIRKFDVVAVQEIRAMDPTLMSRFVQRVNADGQSRYDFVLGPRLGNSDSKEQYAFIYDVTRIEVDQTSAYTVGDPSNLLEREPLVAGFRARSAPPEQAFTFTLVNVHTKPANATEECDALAAAFRSVRNDGRGEDDVIMLGDFNADDRRMGMLRLIPDMRYVIPANIHTNTLNNATYDNILFDGRATSEYVGGPNYGYGVLELTKEFNLTIDQALLVSDHLPIWAEFSVYEGGAPGAMAAAPMPVGR
jgi:endonuclease/exonuclease/phosphatase family metal-dependent hydrolase